MKIAFLGDSITLGYALEDKKYRYSTLVCEALGAEESNFGITGTLVAKAGLNTEDGKDFVTRAELIDDADVAVVFGGTNDYFWSDKTIYGVGDAYFDSALRTIAKRIKEKRAGKVTLFVTPYQHNGVGNYLGGDDWRIARSRHDTTEKNYNGHVLGDYVRAIVDVCKDEGIPCLNLFENFDFKHELHTSDGCHPNERGHELIADAVVKKLKALI